MVNPFEVLFQSLQVIRSVGSHSIMLTNQIASRFVQEGLPVSMPYTLWRSTTEQIWWDDLEMFLDSGGSAMGFRDRFFRRTAVPAMAAYNLYNDMVNPHRIEAALAIVVKMDESEFKQAMSVWLTRQMPKVKE